MPRTSFAPWSPSRPNAAPGPRGPSSRPTGRSCSTSVRLMRASLRCTPCSRPVGPPVVRLLLHQVGDTGKVGNETGVVLGPHDERLHRVQRDHGRGAHVARRRAAFTDQVTGPSFGDDPLLAVLVEADLGPAVE